jgi:hypothetical protein
MNGNTIIVAELRHWIDESRDRLASDAVLITDKLPTMKDNKQSKGCVGLSRGHILISFTVWDRRPIPIELLVYNTHIDKTVIMKDYELQSIKDVLDEINEVARRLASGKYDDLEVDPGLSIS